MSAEIIRPAQFAQTQQVQTTNAVAPTQVLPPAPRKTRVVLEGSRGPAIVVQVIEETTQAGNRLFHVVRFSRFGGPVALVAKDIMGCKHACEIARMELA